ncbi:hypothetical protein ZWY2020_059446 [Hordeum vulgare]|nr:hypothetical protein ZWY2020_059446 [Hordeum vulgare]
MLLPRACHFIRFILMLFFVCFCLLSRGFAQPDFRCNRLIYFGCEAPPPPADIPRGGIQPRVSHSRIMSATHTLASKTRRVRPALLQDRTVPNNNTVHTDA